MSSLPSGWIELAIGDVAEVNPRKDVDLSTSDLVSFVPMAAVDEVSGTILSPIDRPYGEVSKGFTHFRDDDVIFAKITPSMENGKSAVARGLTNGTGMGSTEFHVFRSRGAIEPEYLWRFVRQKSFRENAQAVMSGAVGQQRVPADYLKEHLIPLPPFPEQRRIVAKVDGLTARTARARKELDRIPTLIARYKQRLLALAFSGELTGGSEGWQTATIGELADTQLGKMLDKAKNTGEPTRYLRNINVRWFDFQLDDVLEMPMSDEERRKFSIKDGDILTCEGGEPGRSAIWNKGSTDLAFQKALIRIRPDLQRLNPSYLVYHLKYLADAQELERHFTGSTIKHLPQRALQNVELPLPPIEEQAEIVRRIESAFGWLDRMAADHAAAARLLPKLDAAILAKAFRGELVPQDPNDEPAAKLLERIKAEREATAAKPRKIGRGRPPKGDKVVLASIDVGLKAVAYGNSPRPKGKSGMTKNRQDDDVMGKPYLAGLLKSGRFSDAQSLFRAADLPVADFYKQLAWEIDKGHILDSDDELKAA
ncbi:restriction endonuclease subunit S [Erythrobacter oryzae]|uniref:restriction endonuclease subunit S n=1 Tax=Erythrobacter oryzae TaxID=3019556 RepID=UPI002553AE9A|nr:restriction endonuclease subunit S [Erythrobacter sp. COR-2]